MCIKEERKTMNRETTNILFIPLFLLFLCTSAQAQGLTQTYEMNAAIPPPNAVLFKAQFFEQPDLGATCNPTDAGEIYFNGDGASGNGVLMYCNKAGNYLPLSPVWTQNGDLIYPVDTSSNPNLKVGIGTTSPLVPLHVMDDQVRIEDTSADLYFIPTGAGEIPFLIKGTDGEVRFYSDNDLSENFLTRTLTLNSDGILASQGATGVGAPLSGAPYEGAGTRFLWYPYRAAIRAGEVGGDDWDESASKIGNYSTAFGYDTEASGAGSVSIGITNTASGGQSAVLGGSFNQATDSNGAVVAGILNINNGSLGMIGAGVENQIPAGSNASAIIGGSENATTGMGNIILGGSFNQTHGASSVIIGTESENSGDYSIAMGRGMNIAVGGDHTFVYGYDALGGVPITASDAFIIYPGTNVGIGTINPTTTLHIDNIMKIEPQGAAPACAELGQLYVRDNAINGSLCFCNGTAWQIAAGAGPCI